jgi:hypothetical protein
MSNRSVVVLAFLLLLAAATSTRAQTIYADRFGLVTGPCLITSGAGDPTNTVNGNRCDTYVRTDTGDVYTKQTSGFTSTGWGIIPRLSVANVWTANQTIANASPALLLTNTGAGANLKSWAVGVTGNALTLSTLNDALGTLVTPLSIDRSGNASILGGAAIGGNATIAGTAGITGAVTLGSSIGTANYASQVAGWQINQTGGADFRYVFADELRAKLFTADAESVLAGSLRVTKSYSTVAQPFTCPALGAAGTLWVNDASTYGDAPVFQSGDFVVLHVLTRAAFGPFTITDCVGSVTAYADGSGANAGQQSWTLTRAAGTNGGAMTGGSVVPVNQLVQDMGVSGNGYVEMSAVDGANGSNAPYLQTNTWTTSPIATNTATRCRFGNLNGITASAGEFGMLCGGVGLTQPMIRLSSAAFEIRNLPIDLYDATPVQVFRIDPTAPSVAMGNPLPATYGGGKGFWMGQDAGAYKLRIGDPAGNRLTWDGAILTIAGNGSGITNINGGNITAGTITAAQLNITAHPGGAALNPDPNTSDASMYVTSGNPAFTPAVITTITDGIVGTTSLRSVAGTQAAMSQPSTPVDVHKTYRIHAWARSGGGAVSSSSIRMNTFGGNGGYLGEIGIAIDNVAIPTAWTEYIGTIGPAQFPTGTVNTSIEIYLNYPSPAAGYIEVQDVRIEEMVPSTLIKDGVITTNKIAAHTITAANILANSITVAELDATGFGDNVIKNGAFEGMTLAQALAGWSADPGAGPTSTQSCCGSKGPGTLYITPPAGSYTIIEYRAIPVTSGATYRIAMDSYNTAATVVSGFWVRAFESNQPTAAVQYVRVSSCCLNPGDVANVHATDISASNTSMPGNVWAHYEWVYTVPQGMTWVSLAIQNWTCQVTACTPFHIDNVEMQLQIGAGHIRANSITADRLVANSITSAQIAAGTITAAQIAAGTITAAQIAAGTITTTQIAAGTITGGNIAGGTITGGNIAGRTITAGALVANTITSNEIGVRAIVAGNIATGTLTANEIASATITGDRIAAGTINANNIQSGSITADRLAVTSLSAISANLGTVTAGTINGITINSTTLNSATISGGSININGNFAVASNGFMTAYNATIQNGMQVYGGMQINAGGGGFSNTIQADSSIFVRLQKFSGTNQAYLCVDSGGLLYRGNPTC